MEKKNYSPYKAEDFILDDYFIRSFYHPTVESRRYWEQLLVKKEISAQEYHLAIQYLKMVTVKKKKMTVIEKAQLKNRISRDIPFQTNAHNKGKTNRKRLILFAAATVAIIVISAITFSILQTDKDALTAFVQSSEPTTSDKIELILSNDERVALHENEVSIAYAQSGEVTVNNKKISQEEMKEADNTSPQTQHQEKKAEYNQLIVPFGKRTTLTLADNTCILVNAGTRVVYPTTFDQEKREIFVDGEIFLDVTPNPSCPFHVKTPDMQIVVTGTSFNITAYKNDLEKSVVLVEGCVKIKNKGSIKETVLTPNDRYSLLNGKTSVSQVDVSDYISWKDGLYIFKNEPLKNILARISRYYDIKIQVDEAASALSCSGKLDLKDDVQRVLKALTITAPISLEQNEDNLYLFSYKPQ